VAGIDRERVGAPLQILAAVIPQSQHQRLGCIRHRIRRMPPEAEPRRAVSLYFPAYLVEHLDRQAQKNCCSRNVFLRQLVLDDLKRSQAAARKAQAA
jgi:hypothetical protein